jgi:YgiT-type zinc finger domain-containing protein
MGTRGRNRNVLLSDFVKKGNITMNRKLQIKHCPNCGSELIQLGIRDLTRQYKGQSCTVPAVMFYDCPTCGEKVYDRVAMQKIQQYSLAYQHTKEMVQITHENRTVSSASRQSAAQLAKKLGIPWVYH